MIHLAPKDVADVVDYRVDLTGLDGDAIQSIEIVPTGITVLGSPAPSFTASSVTFWVSGGTGGSVATVRLTVTTAAGRVVRRYLAVPILSV